MQFLWGFIDLKGQSLTETPFESVNSFSEGFASDQQNGLWSLINSSGVLQCEASHELLGKVTNGCVASRNKGLWGVIKTNGDVVLPENFDQVIDIYVVSVSVKIGAQISIVDFSSQRQTTKILALLRSCVLMRASLTSI
jgi:hypothetical protein